MSSDRTELMIGGASLTILEFRNQYVELMKDFRNSAKMWVWEEFLVANPNWREVLIRQSYGDCDVWKFLDLGGMSDVLRSDRLTVYEKSLFFRLSMWEDIESLKKDLELWNIIENVLDWEVISDFSTASFITKDTLKWLSVYKDLVHWDTLFYSKSMDRFPKDLSEYAEKLGIPTNSSEAYELMDERDLLEELSKNLK